MKRAVSVSIGSSKRDKAVEVELFGETVSIERIGTDGDMEKAAQLYKELDGKVDAFGVGGADLGLLVDNKWYPLHSVYPMVRFVKQTPMVDGTGLKNTLENHAVPYFMARHGDYIKDKKAFITLGTERWGLSKSFFEEGFECVFGDMMFSLGVPWPLHSLQSIKRMAAMIAPIASRLPFDWVYPTGESQEVRVPKYEKYYQWASVVAGDCHYVKKHMPDNMNGKVVITNTTTEEDVALFKQVGVKYLVTTTPVLEGRSFGTNMMESAMVAVSGKGRPLTHDELEDMIEKLDLHPTIQELN